MMKKRQKIIPWAAVTLIVLAAAAALYLSFGRNAIQGGRGETGKESQTEVKTEFTEEEKAQLESQTGVTVREDGVVEVNVAERQEAEENVTVKRDEAQEKVLGIMSEEAKILSAGLQNEADQTYWIVRAEEGDQVYQVWINADTGEIYQSRRE